MLDLRLNTFLIVSKIKNFTKAAQILNLTQPAVSQHIKFLEDYYGVTLIKKQGREIYLTEEGEILFKYAQKLEMLYRTLDMELRNRSGINKTYNVGATRTIGDYVLPYILGRYKNIHINIDILLQVSNTREVIERLLSMKLDLALVEGPFDKGLFKYKKFKDDELVLAVSPKHCFSKRENVELQEVLEGNLILREKGSGTRKIIENKLVEVGYNLNMIKPYMEIGSINAIKSLVESNLGYTIISRETIKRELELGLIKIVPIKDIYIPREFNFIYLNEDSDGFIEHFTTFCCIQESKTCSLQSHVKFKSHMLK